MTYAYDNLNRITSASQTGNALSFTWDALGRHLTQAVPQGIDAAGFGDLAEENGPGATTPRRAPLDTRREGTCPLRTGVTGKRGKPRPWTGFYAIRGRWSLNAACS